MTPERWQQVMAVLDEAFEAPPAERTAFVAAACGEDEELRAEVESLLAFEGECEDFLEEPLFGHSNGETAELAPGRRVGPYRVVREIGRGGMGAVYLAVRADEEYEKEVALKVVGHGTAAEIVRRFRAERQILAHLDHPHIAKLLDGGTTEDGRPYFVMELVAGEPIDEACAARGLSIRQRLVLFREVCAAVHFAHQNLVVHRDLKPGNILVTAEGVPKLLDFGIAKLLDPAGSDPAATELGLRPMTLQYASPEQLGEEPITTASDVYSLGVLLFVLLTGRSPYGRAVEDRKALERAILEGRIEKPSLAVERRGEARLLAGDLDTIVARALDREPGRRYASAEQLAADVERYLAGHPVLARPDTTGYRFGKFVRRHKAGVAAAAAGLLLVLGFSITVTLLLRKAERERDRAGAMSKFLEDLFTIPDPSRSRGETITAREVLDRGRQQISQGLRQEPEIRAAFLETMGRVYHHLGLLEDAHDLLAESLRIRRKTLGRDHLEVASSLQNLSLVLRDMGRDGEAWPLLEEALAIRRQRGATRTPEYAAGLNDLAALREAKGDYEKAEELFTEALALKRRLLGPAHKDVAIGLNNLAHIRQVRGDLAGAERLYREALTLRRGLFGGPHPEVATSLNNLASILEDRGNLGEAERFYQEALAMRRKLFGERNSKVAQSLNNVGFILLAEGRAGEAEPLVREAVSIADELLDPRHPYRAVFRRNLAAALAAQGRGREGEPLAREALAFFQASKVTPWQPAVAESILGSCLTVQGRFAEAEPLLLSSYSVLDRDPGAGAGYAPAALRRIVELYTAWGRPERAAAYRVGARNPTPAR
jgi:eukaryotic-like serine/threonine-protein kinase